MLEELAPNDELAKCQLNIRNMWPIILDMGGKISDKEGKFPKVELTAQAIHKMKS